MICAAAADAAQQQQLQLLLSAGRVRVLESFPHLLQLHPRVLGLRVVGSAHLGEHVHAPLEPGVRQLVLAPVAVARGRHAEALRPAGPATSATPDKWQPNFNSMDQQRADALSSARTNPTDRSPLDALREVSSDAHQRTLEHHQALDAHAAATGTPGEAAAARAVFESAHRLAPAQAAMDRLLGPSATGKVIDRKQQLQRAKLLQTAGEQLPLLQKDHPSVTGNASKIVEPLSRGIKPTLRGGLYGAAGTLGYEALPYIRSGISSLFSSPPQAPQAPQQ